MMSEEQPQKDSFDKWEKHLENTKQIVKYAIERFDILIVTLSSGGIAFTMSFAKDIKKDQPHVDLCIIKYVTAFFGLALVLNLISQVTSYYANKYEIKCVNNIIREKKKKEMIGNQTTFEKIKNRLNKSTDILNAVSLFSVIIAVLLISIFVFRTI